ncbi:MAG: response regulator transcription factor [Anaerolineae bacterium]
MTERIRVLVTDDHDIVREGLRAVIESKPDMELVGEAQPDVILMDLVMPGLNGIQAIEQIRSFRPEARILVLTSFGEDGRVISAIRAGALGYLLKDSSPHELVDAIRCVHRGEPSVHPDVARTLFLRYRQDRLVYPGPDVLSEREMEVLRLVAHGLSNRDIAAELSIVEGTVRFHVGNILSKLALENRAQAVLYALREGLATIDG